MWHGYSNELRQGQSWSNLSIIKSAKCGGTCNPHAVWSKSSHKLVVTFASDVGIATLSTADPTGHSGWSSPVSLAPWLGKEWTSRASIPGPGVATAIVLPGGGERLLFVAHAGAYKQDAVFYSDDAGATFHVSASTPFNPAANVLKAMDEAAFAQLSNGSVLLVLRNLGGEGEAKRFPNGSRPPYHNPRCADNGICKAFSRSDDHGLTYARSTPSTAARAFRLLCGVSKKTSPANIICCRRDVCGARVRPHSICSWSEVEYFGDVRSGSCEAGVLDHNKSLYISVGDSGE